MGATGGGVWKTLNAGQSWENISGGTFKVGSIGAIAVAPSDPNVVYVGTGSACPRGNVSVGNGNPSSHEADKAEKRKAFNGLAMVIIQASKRPGMIKLTAESSDLETTVVEITSVKSAIRPRVP